MIYVVLSITTLTLVLLVVSFWTNHTIINVINANVKKNREKDENRQEQIDRLAKDFLKAIQLVMKYQDDLEDKMNALSELVDRHNTYVTSHQAQFDSLAKADLLAARREELIRTKELKVALERLMGVAMTSRQPPAPNDVLALEFLDRRITDLEEILNK